MKVRGRCCRKDVSSSQKLIAIQITLVLVVEEQKAPKHSGAAGAEWGLPAKDEDVLKNGTETVCF